MIDVDAIIIHLNLNRMAKQRRLLEIDRGKHPGYILQVEQMSFSLFLPIKTGRAV